MAKYVEFAKDYIGRIIENTENHEEKIQRYIHTYQVAGFSMLLAMKRKQDPELAVVAGLLHDCYTYSTGEFNDHAVRGAQMVENDAQFLEMFESDALRKICKSIERHSSKKNRDSLFDEILKDADVLSHYFESNFHLEKEAEVLRIQDLKKEFE